MNILMKKIVAVVFVLAIYTILSLLEIFPISPNGLIGWLIVLFIVVPFFLILEFLCEIFNNSNFANKYLNDTLRLVFTLLFISVVLFIYYFCNDSIEHIVGQYFNY